MKTNYNKIRQIGKNAGITLAIIYGINFAGEEANYLISKYNLDKVRGEYKELLDEDIKLGIPNRDYPYWSDWETFNGKRVVSSMARKSDNNTRRMIELGEKKRMLEDKTYNAKIRRFTIF